MLEGGNLVTDGWEDHGDQRGTAHVRRLGSQVDEERSDLTLRAVGWPRFEFLSDIKEEM